MADDSREERQKEWESKVKNATIPPDIWASQKQWIVRMDNRMMNAPSPLKDNRVFFWEFILHLGMNALTAITHEERLEAINAALEEEPNRNAYSLSLFLWSQIEVIKGEDYIEELEDLEEMGY